MQQKQSQSDSGCDKNEVAFFIHPDTKRHDDFSGNTGSSGDISNVVVSKTVATLSDSHKCSNTRFFYSTTVDKKMC